MKTKLKTLSASEFKTRCLKFLDELEPQGIIVTKRGQPVVKVLPMCRVQFQELNGSMKGKLKVKGDTLSTGIRWNAESGRC